ncbi:hypothetical protein KC340_g12546 [Hortaea werneckii]|nr:hypothetical protein KC342_g15706 [Hortaea werneckii]KAI7215168.1 hypothetical protein KC365_g13664 [Hortaea werneckii]KAI7303215.1 hypothetical protein KC340_g12546 [Hortaea werneckii]KAI7389890.1 hypothetical protein KC328_g8217 [Hortaea werneckii]
MSRGVPRKPLQDRHYSSSTDDEGSDHDSAEAERRQPASTNEEGSEHESAEAERGKLSPIDEQGSDHDAAEAEGNYINEGGEGSQTRPTGQSTSVDEEVRNHESAEAEGSNENEHQETNQTRPPSNDFSFARAAQVFATDVRTAWNRFELDRIPREGTSPTPIVEQGSTAIYHAPSILQFYFTNTPPGIHTASTIDHPTDNRTPSVSNKQSSPGGDTRNPRKPALDSAEIPGDEEVESGGERESVGAEIRGERENWEDGARDSDDGDIRSDKGGSGDIEEEAHTEESPDGDTIIVRKPRNQQSRTQDETENVTRGHTLSRSGGRSQRRAGSSGWEEDVYGSSVSSTGRHRPDTCARRDDQSVADDDANQSEGDESDQLPEDEVHQTPRQPHGRSTSGRNWYYASGPETTTVSATVDASNILSDAADGRRLSRQSRQNSVAASGHAAGAGHAVSAQRHVEERRVSTHPGQQNNQADTRTPSRPNRGIRGSPEKQRATLPSIPEERPTGRRHIPAPHNPGMTSKRKRQDRVNKMPARPRSLSPASQDQDMAAMGIGTLPTQTDTEAEEEEESGEGKVMETIPEERSDGDESENDDAKGPGENKKQRHPEQIDPPPREPESKNKKTDSPPGLLKSHLKATGSPRVADRKKATEEEEVPSAGSEGSTSSLTDLTLESEEEQPPVKPPAKRQKTRHLGRD